MSISLTDDEVAAICVAMRLPWPSPFPTIDASSDALAAAAERGLRSLAVRGLVTGAETAEVASEVATMFALVGGASRQITTYVAAATAPSTLAGSAAYAYFGVEAAEPAIVEFVTAGGVHQILAGTRVEVHDLMSQLVKSTFDYGFRGEHGDDAVLSVLGSDASSPALLVREGEFVVGRIDAGSAGFVPIATSTSWDPQVIDDVLMHRSDGDER